MTKLEFEPMLSRTDTAETRRQFRQWTDCLLDPARAAFEQRQAAHEWCQWGLNLLGIDEGEASIARDPFYADIQLATGKAISPLGAARCIREYRRTAVFLQALEAAITLALARFPRETIHVMEAGCGPLAPLAFTFAERYPPDRVAFTLLDLHPTAIEGARYVAHALGVTPSIRAFRAGDATTCQFRRSERPHIIVCEVLLRALTKEPQVAVTRNLVPQLRRGGFFLPERVDIDAGLSSEPSIAEVGRAFSLDARTVRRLKQDKIGRLKGNRVRVPAHDRIQTPLQLFTRIQVFGEHRLGDNESSLNLPERIAYPAAVAQSGGELQFTYEMSSDPGLRIEHTEYAEGSEPCLAANYTTQRE